MRLLVKFFLSCCLLLLKGYGQLYADTEQEAIYNSLCTLSESSVHINVTDVHTTQAIIKSANPSGAKKVRFKLKATEVDDDDDVSPGRKHHLLSDYCNCYPQQPASFCTYYKHPLPFCRHFSYASSEKFIVHRVIRI